MPDELHDALDQFYRQQTGVELSAEEHCNIGKPWARPIVSRALKVHPDQVAEATERNRKRGCSVTYLPDGRPVIPDRNERKKLLKIEGMIDKDSYTGY